MTRLLLAVVLAGCAGGGGDQPAGPAPAAPVVVETIDQAVAAKGKLALVKGTAQREKMGDSIAVQELTVHCLDVRFPDAAIGTAVAAQGTLEVQSGFAATGAISQGTEGDDDSRWVLRGCAPR